VILINCDDLGYGDLGCYGSTANRTPALDRMADQGLRLTSFYMASPVCSPSRGAMMTGCYPPRISFGKFEGAWVLFPGMSVGLSSDETTVASLLKDRGYATQIVGKWHCGDQKEFLPTRHGFDGYYGIPYSNDMGRQNGCKKMWCPLPLMDDEEVIQAQPDQASIIERYTEKSLRFLRENQDQPFFLYLAHMQVHLPLYAPKPFVDASENGRYGACVEAVNWSTDVILRELQRLGLEENTIVIFTSDNGSRGDNGGSNAPLNGRKGTTWEGGQRVPCIVRWKGQIQPGRTSDEILSSIDFLPSLCRICGAEVPDRKIDGLDASDFLLGKTEQSPRETFFYYMSEDLEAVRKGKWKLFVWRKGEEVRELYDLESDIGETRNLIEDHPEIVEQLQDLLQEMRQDLGDDRLGIEGKGVRPCGKVESPVTLTEYDPDHPYIMAEYDLPERG
jgi:arylsulfatase A-like enzyme